MMVQNLNQLKKALTVGTKFVIVSHFHSECVGEYREVKEANTQGIYSIVPGEPQNKTTTANYGRGTFLGWGKAPYWKFEDGLCCYYGRGGVQSKEKPMFSFRLLDEEAA